MADRGDRIEQLLDEMEGVYVVATDDGTAYLLDLEAREVTSFAPGDTAAPGSPGAEWLMTLVTCRVGQPMVMLLDRGLPGVWFTRRATRPVATITASGRAIGRLARSGRDDT
ncbi:hypothetical protein [Microbacterium sp.]|uniref:hypothetical protein n=1 Tax=Microbacterium sp. TaxID=51671 RepID=UPI002B5AFAED|nr:hypothetical protein [Microbacterium sp.]HWL77593.1 hypothetical protein [Microbacterium sp.]